MNRSGTAVNALLTWLKIEPAQLLVVVDDADLPLGQFDCGLRVAAAAITDCGRSSRRSVANEEFARLRVGIGRSAIHSGADISGHVLGRFATAEREWAGQAVAVAVEAMDCCLREGLTEAMNQFNRKKSAE